MLPKRLKNLKFIPREMRGVTELRRNPGEVFAVAEKKEAPVLITEFSEPRGVIVSLDTYENILGLIDMFEEETAVAEALGLADALDSISVYRQERAARKLKEIRTLKELF